MPGSARRRIRTRAASSCAQPQTPTALGARSLLRSNPRAPRARRQDAAEEAKLLREEMVQLFKQFRAAGGSKAMQDKLIRDFQSLNKKMLETTKQTRTPALLSRRPAAGLR